MKNYLLFICVGLAATAPNAVAQHDLQRDAVRLIAKGQYDQAAVKLASGKKPYGGPAESLFVEALSLLAQDKIEAAETKARAALAAGLPLGRLAAGPRELLKKLPPLKAVPAPDLIHGPMVGALTESGASIWLRTREAAEISIMVGDRKINGKTSSESNFTGVVKVDGLKPNTAFVGKLLINGNPVEGGDVHFTTAPSADKPRPFTVAFGGGAGFVPEWEYMWDTILSRKPLAFLTLGDNVYSDDPEHPITQHYCYSRTDIGGLLAV